MTFQESRNSSENINEDELSSHTSLDTITFTKCEKKIFLAIYFVLTIGILVVLQLAKGVLSPNVSVNTMLTLDVSSNVESILLFEQLFFIFVLLPYTIYDIIKDQYFKNLKGQAPLIVIVAGIVALFPMLFLYLTVSGFMTYLGINGDFIIYLGVSPEVLMFSILFPFILYYSPPYFFIKFFRN